MLANPLNSTLGFTIAQRNMPSRLSKMTLAREQLEDGIALFLSARYVSALTLLGAAEEILSRLIEESEGAHPLEADWHRANSIRSRLGKPHISKRQIFQIYNHGRNTVKHHTPSESRYVQHDRFGEAFMMIQRAISSAERFKLKYKGRREYTRWYINNGWGSTRHSA